MSIKLILGKTLAVGTMLVGGLVGSGSALAAIIECPNPITGTQDRVYATSGASDCVWGNGNIGQGQPANDAFLKSLGTNDAMYGNSGPTFGLTWTTIDSQDYVNSGWGLNGLTISNYDGDYFEWLLTDTNYTKYALGLKDGGEPKWAVFLLNSTSGIAEILSQGGSWSHVVLYGTNNGGGDDDEDDDDEIPEPATLALVGLSLVGLAASRRRRTPR